MGTIPCFSTMCKENFLDFLFAFLDNVAFPNRGLLLERISTLRRKFFALTLIQQGSKHENSGVASLKVFLFTLIDWFSPLIATSYRDR